MKKRGRSSSLVGHLLDVQRVVGSSPARPTNETSSFQNVRFYSDQILYLTLITKSNNKRFVRKMEIIKVHGKNNKHKILLYALSTCAWCKMTKQFLKDNSVEFEYVDVDLCDKADREKIHNDIKNRGGDLTYPTMIVDDKSLINGFLKDKIKKALEI